MYSILLLHYKHHSDGGFLIRLESLKDSNRVKEKDKEKEKEKDKEKHKDSSNPSVSYSHSALPVSSEAISLFRFLLRTEDWKALVEQTLLRPLIDMTNRIRAFQVSSYISFNYMKLLKRMFFSLLFAFVVKIVINSSQRVRKKFQLNCY